MRPRLDHAWLASDEEAIKFHEELRGRLVRKGRVTRLDSIAGVEVRFDRAEGSARAALALLSFPDLEWTDLSFGLAPCAPADTPLLRGFRALAAVVDALTPICARPGLVLCGGHGLAHPQRLGLACQVGALLDRPSIGVAGGRGVAVHEPVPEGRGSWRPLIAGGEVVGAAVRTRDHARPLYVSVGHRVSLERAIDLVLAMAPRYRLPQPLREARRWMGRRPEGG